MNEYVNIFAKTLFTKLLSRCPIDTGNMVSHITLFSDIKNDQIVVTIAAPAKKGDYSKFVNYARKSPHRFWVENQIKSVENIVISNANYGLYNNEGE